MKEEKSNKVMYLYKKEEAGKGRSERISRKLFIRDDPRWENALVYLLDDSIIRGNVSKKVSAELRKRGVRKIILVSGFPPFIVQCHLGVSTRTQEELIAARHMVKSRLNKVSLAAEIGVDEIVYISNRGFLRARGYMNIKPLEDPRLIFLANGGCGGCITGNHPVDKHGILHPLIEKRLAHSL